MEQLKPNCTDMAFTSGMVLLKSLPLGTQLPGLFILSNNGYNGHNGLSIEWKGCWVQINKKGAYMIECDDDKDEYDVYTDVNTLLTRIVPLIKE